MVKMGQSLEKYRDAKLQQFRNQLPAEEAHVRKTVKRLKLRVTAVYIRHRVVLSNLSVSLKSVIKLRIRSVGTPFAFLTLV